MKISRLEIENVKRVQAVRLEPTENGLTVIGGRNGQGKTSILDAILWGLGGNRYKPTSPKRDDAAADPRICIELDNGLTVMREGKNASLKVIDPEGNRAGQSLLDALISALALDLPKFLHANPKEKAEMLLQVIGAGDQLRAIDKEIEQVYNERHLLGQTLTRKRKHAEDLPFEEGVPEEEISASDLIQQHQQILARNGENQRLRARKSQLEQQFQVAAAERMRLRQLLEEIEKRLDELQDNLAIATKTAEELEDESTEDLERSLQTIDETNRRVRVNRTKRQAEEDAAAIEEQVDGLTDKLDAARASRLALLLGSKLPLAGLSIADNGELTYLGKQWDCLAGSEQMRVGVAIARAIKPDCQFVLLDKLEQMDLQTLSEFGEWLESEGLQAIATRVSTGGECQIIIEDGLIAGGPVMRPAIVSDDDEGGF
jgi:predicted nucleic acid-binding protein